MDIIAYALAKGYTKKAIDDLAKSLGTPLLFKGTVALKTDLPTTGNKIGEIYHVVENKNEYIWMDDNGAQRWEDIGPIMTGVAHINDSVVNENDTWSSKKINDNDIKEISSSIDEEKITTVITKKDNTQITAEALLASPTLITDNQALHKKEMPLRAESVKVNSISGKTEKSKNLISFPYVFENGTEKGITYTQMPDGGIKLEGTATDNVYLGISTNNYFGNRSFNSDMDNTPTNGYIATLQNGSSSIYILYSYDVHRTNLTIVSGTTTNVTVYPQIEKADIPTPFEKGYTGLHNAKVTAIKGATTTSISPEVLGLPDYGEGVEGHENTVDYIEGKYKHNAKKISFNGTESGWQQQSLGSYFIYTIVVDDATIDSSVGLAAPYNYESNYGGASVFIRIDAPKLVAGKDISSQFPDVAAWKAHLAELSAAGNPLTIVYPIAETITPLVSSAPSVTVSSLGDFELVNEHNIDMPNSIEVATALPTPVSNEQAISQKISLPKNPDGTPDYGAAGQILVSDGTGGITWKDELKVTVTDNPDGTVNLNIS